MSELARPPESLTIPLMTKLSRGIMWGALIAHMLYIPFLVGLWLTGERSMFVFALVMNLGAFRYAPAVFRRAKKQLFKSITFSQEGLALKRRSTTLETASWEEIVGYRYDGKTGVLQIRRLGKKPIELGPETHPMTETVAPILKALNERMSPEATREIDSDYLQNLVYRDNPFPKQELVPGQTYRYDNPTDLDKAFQKDRKVVFMPLIMLLLLLSGFVVYPWNWIYLPVASIVAAILAPFAVAFAIRRNRRRVNFKRTFRDTITAVEGGIMFSGDPRIYRPLNEVSSGPDKTGRYDVYVAGKEQVVIDRTKLRPAEPSLTAQPTWIRDRISVPLTPEN